MLTFVIPSPPSVNGLFANVPGRGRVRSKGYRIWRNAAGWALKTEGTQARSWETIAGPVEVRIVNGSQRLDGDNSAKAILDLLVDMRVIGDDRQVVDLRITRGAKSREATVTVREIAA